MVAKGEFLGRIPASHRFLYKPLAEVETGGCELLVWAPKTVSDPAGVAFMIHGGAWGAGSAWTIPYGQVNWFIHNKIAVVSVGYRLIPHVGMSEIRQDCLDAYRFVQSDLNARLASAGSALAIDPKKVAILGWSAGGYCAVALAADALASSEQLWPPVAMVPTYALLDASYVSQASMADYERILADKQEVMEAAKRVWGEPCQTGWAPRDVDPLAPYDAVHEAWKPTSSAAEEPSTETAGEEVELAQAKTHASLYKPFRATWLDALTSTNIFVTLFFGEDPPYAANKQGNNLLNASFPPTFVVAAEDDKLIPLSNSTDLYEKLTSLGVEAHLGVARNMWHGACELPGWPSDCEWWEEAILPSLEFVAKKMA